MSDLDRIQSAAAELRSWTVREALPYWGGAGFDWGKQSFVERADFSGRPLASAPRRTMVQARQIYVFAHAALLGWRPEGRKIAIAAAHNLIDRHLSPDGQPGWIFSTTHEGAVHDARRDFYTHAFALFGLAWAHRLQPDPRFLEAALQTVDDLDRHFASPAGGYYAALPPDRDALFQNPHMHLFEAMIAWFEASGEERFLARAAEIRGLAAARFFQPRTGVLAEYFDGAWKPLDGLRGRVCEPGHHYEWSWLLERYAGLIGRPGDPVAQSLYDFADRHGFDPDGLIVDECLDDGSVHKTSRRCWPHAEAIKANVAAFEAGDERAAERAARTIDRLMQVFLGRPTAGGWIDRIDERGAPLVAFVPASTLYHVFRAAAEADRVWGRGNEGAAP
jgi:mannose-6-phosphate isomerase